MSDPSTWGKIEWEFVRSDWRFWEFKDPDGNPCPRQQLAYLSLWLYCAATTTDWFRPSRWAGEVESLASACRCPLSVVTQMVETSVRTGLISRKLGGVLIVEGVRLMHDRKRGWGPEYSPRSCGTPIRGEESRGEPPNPQGGSSPNSMSLKAALDEKIRQIKAGEITTGIENGVSRVARVVAGKLLLEPNYGVSSRDKQITVSRRDVGRFTWE